MTITSEHPLLDLPFASFDGGTISLWRADLRDGRHLADACIGRMSETGATPLLGRVAKAQIAVGIYGETEIAFWQRIAERVI